MAESTRQRSAGGSRPDPRKIRGVVEVSALIAERVHRAFPEPLWARGEILNCVFDEHGAAHFDLVEQPDGRAQERLPEGRGQERQPHGGQPERDPRAGRGQEGRPRDAAAQPHEGGPSAPAELHVHLTREAFARVRAALAAHDVDPRDLLYDGQSVLVSGQLTYAGGRIGLRMDGLDHEATTGMLTAAKNATRARLRDAGLADAQRRLPSPVAPVRVALVGGAHDTGLRACLQAMTTAELSIHARTITVGLEGRGAVGALADAITQAAAGEVDAVLVVRGEGIGASRAPFDAEPVAAAVAAADVPVITGIQVQGATLTDEVAHLACETPAKAGTEVVRRLRTSLRRLRQTERDAQDHARAALDGIAAEYTTAATRLDAVVAGARQRSRRRLRWDLARRLALAAAALAAALLLVALASTWQRAALALLAAAGCVVVLRRLAIRGDLMRHHPTVSPPRSFTEALERLETIRGELAAASAPETVVALSQEAAELRRWCESLLGWAEQSLGHTRVPPPQPQPQPIGAPGEATPGEPV